MSHQDHDAAARGEHRTTKRRVIDAGARVFAREGFHAATKEKIGEAAGFSHQTVRDQFRTTRALLAAVTGDVWRDVRAVLDVALPGDDGTPAEARVALALRAYDALADRCARDPWSVLCALHEARRVAGTDGGAEATLETEEERAVRARLLGGDASGPVATATGDLLMAALDAALVRAARASVEETPGGTAMRRAAATAGRPTFATVARALLVAG
jgi:AcrR family transcriptional regulator